VYYLNGKGREWVGSENEVKWSLQVEHYLMRNDIWIYYYSPKDWVTEQPINIKVGLEQHVLVPDASFTIEGKWYFVEVDRMQDMKKNREKIELYSKLSPLMEKQYGHRPTVVFYTTTPVRKDKLKQLCVERQLMCRVMTKGDLV
jgi:hypothetical protein